MTFIIHGETPPKKNSRINTRSGRSFPSKRYMDWHMEAGLEVLLQRKDMMDNPVNSPCRIIMTFTHGDLKPRDSDNQASSILDLLKDAEIISDDNWRIVRQLHIENEYVKNEPCCKIEVEVL